MGKTAKCIYCLKEKPESEFNREHVISRMLGTYNNAPVLNRCEVCKECNTYFCNEIENVVSMDSYEGLLRTQKIDRAHNSVGRPIGKTRLRITGQNDVFKGLGLLISENPNNPGNIQIEAAPSVGIVHDASKNEYTYYQLDSIPECSDTIQRNMAQSSKPIITFGYDEAEVSATLSSKGYDLSKAKYTGNLNISDITDETDLLLQICSKVDNLLARLAAKNIFNYLCFRYGKEYVLEDRFDSLRSFIRNGHVTSTIKMHINSGGLAGIPGKVVDGHIIGTALASADDLYLCGFVSWFGAITYSFLLDKWSYGKEYPEMPFAICDNKKRKIVEGKNPLCVEWPNSKYSINIIENNIVIVPKK